ncbi:hypothetical protein ES705_16836 [subsurface metagenome]
MTKVEDYDVPEELYCHKEYMWQKLKEIRLK